jgi:hypothetical protein
VGSLEADGAAVRNLTVDGDRQGNGTDCFVGVASHEASVYVGSVTVTHVRGGGSEDDGDSESPGGHATGSDPTRVWPHTTDAGHRFRPSATNHGRYRLYRSSRGAGPAGTS